MLDARYSIFLDHGADGAISKGLTNKVMAVEVGTGYGEKTITIIY